MNSSKKQTWHFLTLANPSSLTERLETSAKKFSNEHSNRSMTSPLLFPGNSHQGDHHPPHKLIKVIEYVLNQLGGGSILKNLTFFRDFFSHFRQSHEIGSYLLFPVLFIDSSEVMGHSLRTRDITNSTVNIRGWT